MVMMIVMRIMTDSIIVVMDNVDCVGAAGVMMCVTGRMFAGRVNAVVVVDVVVAAVMVGAAAVIVVVVGASD